MIIALISVFSLAWISNAMPLAKRMVDMTHVFDETTQYFPPIKKFQIDSLFNGTIENFGGLWLQTEEYSSSTHAGTHMDAPAHFAKGGMTIDQIPVSQFIAPAAVIDITAKAELDPDADASVDDLLRWEAGTGQSLNGTIVLLKSGWGRKWQDRDAFYGTPERSADKLHFPGIAPEASQWLVDNRDIKGIGTETLSIDKGATRDYLSHVILLGHGLFVLENVANVDKLPMYGAKLYVLPMKIGKASGAPTRIVASIPEVIYNFAERSVM